MQQQAAQVGKTTPAPMGSVDAALSHALALLGQQPAAALEQAGEILKAVPGHPMAQLIAGSAQRQLGNTDAALAMLGELADRQPKAAAVHYELGVAQADAGRGDAALASLRHAAALNPQLPGVWRELAGHLSAAGDSRSAGQAWAQHLAMSSRDPRLMQAGAALCANEIPQAEALLRAHLREHPSDVAALRMLAEVAARIGRYGDAETLLVHCLELAPGFTDARAHYAIVLDHLKRPLEALAQVEQLLKDQPRNPNLRNLKASALLETGEFEAASVLYAGLVAEYPQQARIWLSYGHVLRTLGRQEQTIAAYRRCIALEPGRGEAWWSLANLKTFRFTREDIAAMEQAAGLPDASDDDRLQLHFALGKAREDAGEYRQSFEHYRQANDLRRAQLPAGSQGISRLVERSVALLTPQFLQERAGAGCSNPDPIFILGMPRAGSTLVDQILSSHSQVEGTMELSDLTTLVRGLSGAAGDGRQARYPDTLADLVPEQLRELGAAYLERTRVQRKTTRPFFIDKLPNNFQHIGLILLALPNARIIDARRHPLACCFSNYKQHFARGQAFSYGLEDLGRYYSDYVALMAHVDRVAPGRVHRVHYEALVEDTEARVRALLDYCGLPFEDACLRFHENKRAVRTASSEQVRKPIFRDGLDQWRHYEPWLGPLKVALGPVLEAYPAVPASMA